MERYEFAYSCVAPADSAELDRIIDIMAEATAEDFLSAVGLKEANDALLYGIRYDSEEKIKEDWAIRFYYAKKGKIDAWVLVNSAIEYIFKRK